MSAARIVRLTARLELYLTAEEAILAGNQSWSSPDGMTYSRADLGWIQKEIAKIEGQLDYFTGSAYQGQAITFGRPAR